VLVLVLIITIHNRLTIIIINSDEMTLTESSMTSTRNATLAGPILKSPAADDGRDYRGLVLSNKMKVLLISDPTTDKAAASLCVAVGN
jgi:hypothetical protein